MMELLNLDASTIPLKGRHLIEASAGTGKTYNITRIYLRLLLERELTVEQILLMTFTKDATQELRGRIDSFIRDALNNWSTLCLQDTYFKSIDDRVEPAKREFMLKRALLFLDEASIFTIHGFCQRALTQHAFSSGLSFNSNMSTDSTLLALEACQDWFRQLAKQGGESFNLVAQFWAHPNSFMSSFGKAITHDSDITVEDVSNITRHVTSLAVEALTSIETDVTLLNEQLITHKNPEEVDKRREELNALISWLKVVANLDENNPNETELRSAIKTPLPSYLLNANRYPKAFKTTISNVLSPCKSLKKVLDSFVKDIDKAKAYFIVKQAILQIRQQVANKKTILNTLDFDDLINTLSLCVSPSLDGKGEGSQTTLAKKLLAQYPVALVDEFQDTDPKQFSILKGIYYTSNSPVDVEEEVAANKSQTAALYLIGDPKQAIYGFRGGDVFAYLSAREGCDYHWLMDTNWRSSPGMINAYNQLFSGSAIRCEEQPSQCVATDDKVFGYNIPYQAVKAGKSDKNALNINSQLSCDSRNKSLNFIHFESEDNKTAQSQRPLLAKWCANEITALIKGSKICSTDIIHPKDIAILVRDGAEGHAIKQALLDANIPSVFLSDRSNLFDSEQAQQIILLLKGVISPENERHFLGAITCGLLGFDLERLYQLQRDELAFQQLTFDFIDYRNHWQTKGFISMAIAMMHRHFKISSRNKDRVLTNVLHLFEVLQIASQRLFHPQELLFWFEQQCDTASNRAEIEAEQRLESDGDLVRIITQHGSKGLEYPIVFIPFASRQRNPLKFGNKQVTYIEYHNDKNELILSLDGDEEAKKRMSDEAYAESIRLLYVAITRAERKCYIFTTPFDYYHLSPLGKTLKWKADETITNSLTELVNCAPQDIGVEVIALQDMEDVLIEQLNVTVSKEQQSVLSYQASQFKGHIERDWWLSSFTALSKKLRHDGKSSPDRDSDLMTLPPDTSSHLGGANKLELSLLRFNMVKGAHTGNFLHSLLEHIDFTQVGWQQHINQQLIPFQELISGYNVGDLNEWLAEIIQCYLSGVNEGAKDQFSLSDMSAGKILKEVEFYFPMVNASSSQLIKLLTEHRNSYINSISRITTRTVRLPSYTSLKGMMHGFIDLIFEQGGKY